MKRLLASDTDNVNEWRIDAQGRVTHGTGIRYTHHEAKTIYCREQGKWQKLGYWCDRCMEGLLLERGRPGLAAREAVDRPRARETGLGRFG